MTFLGDDPLSRENQFNSLARFSVPVDTVSRFDTIAYLSQLGMRANSDLSLAGRQTVMIDVAACSRDLLDEMFTWEVADQIAPFVLLEQLGDRLALPFPSFENGLVDLWDDEPAAHAAAAHATPSGKPHPAASLGGTSRNSAALHLPNSTRILFIATGTPSTDAFPSRPRM